MESLTSDPELENSLGQKRKSEATPKMSAVGGEADVIRSKADIDLKSMNRRPFGVHIDRRCFSAVVPTPAPPNSPVLPPRV